MSKWLIDPIRWSDEHKSNLLFPLNNTLDNYITLEDIIEKSSKFPIKFPIDSPRCGYLKSRFSKKTLEMTINSTYPIIHEYGLYLCSTFLCYQKKYGLTNFYREMSLIDLINRLLKKRAISFLNPQDVYKLQNDMTGAGNWESIGTENEKQPLIIENCLSYDEIKLSALLSVSSHSVFLNNGDRYNCGKFEENRMNVEESGVIVGLIGTRLEKPNVMEYREIIKSKQQNSHSNGFGQSNNMQAEFSKFYGDSCQTFEELKETLYTSKNRYINLGSNRYFDKLMYQKRIAISIDTLLIEANYRAKCASTVAYVHVVGLGLGVWKICEQQNKIFMDTFAQRLELLSNCLENMSDVRFAYIREQTAGNYRSGDKINHIKLHILNSNPQEKLKQDDEGKLLVVSYPWDGNAFPGNEFWNGSLSGSGDPAAASSTQVAELHNPCINPKVDGNNLRIATHEGVITFWEYQQLHIDD